MENLLSPASVVGHAPVPLSSPVPPVSFTCYTGSFKMKTPQIIHLFYLINAVPTNAVHTNAVLMQDLQPNM